MAVTFRNNCRLSDFGSDYDKIRDFLIKLNDANYLFGRWDWMITHSHLDPEGLARIGLWESDNEVVAMSTYDCTLGSGYFCVHPEYAYLKGEMLLYSREQFGKDGNFRALLADFDSEFHDSASELGFVPTEEKECDAVFPIDVDAIEYRLPDGFSLHSLKEDFDLYQYGKVLWKGFGHEENGEGEYKLSDSEARLIEKSMQRPNVNLDLKIVVCAPNGDFVSYCGMWQDPKTESALVEPVATDPAFRRLGLGRAAVLEGIRRCGKLGSKKAFVGSSQQFYYSIGFRPYRTSTWWQDKGSQ